MSRDRIFVELEPQGGGVADLQRRIGQARARRRRSYVLASLLLASLLSTLWYGPALLPGGASRAAAMLGDDLLAIELGYREPPTEPLTVREGLRNRIAVKRVPTANPKVAYYLVGSLATPGPAPEDSPAMNRDALDPDAALPAEPLPPSGSPRAPAR